MASMDAVKQSLTDEIKTARDGVAFYSNRIVVLEKMLGDLDRMDTTSGAAGTHGHKGNQPAEASRRAGVAKMGRPVGPGKKSAPAGSSATGEAGETAVTKPAKAGQPKSQASKLPPTKAEFWISLLGPEPISNKDWLKAALTTLKIRPNPSDMTKLKQRLANFITISAKEGVFVSDGTGRNRRYSAKTDSSTAPAA